MGSQFGSNASLCPVLIGVPVCVFLRISSACAPVLAYNLLATDNAPHWTPIPPPPFSLIGLGLGLFFLRVLTWSCLWRHCILTLASIQQCKAVLQHCFALFEKDYVVGTVPNHNGQLCPSYPSELAILEKPRQPTQKVDGPGKADMQESNKGQSRSTQGDVASIPTDPLLPAPSASLLTSSSSRIHPVNSSISPRFATHNGTTADRNEGDNNHNSQHGPIHSESMDNSMIEEGDQSFDLGESGMMSFQDIKTELDFIHHPSPLKNPAQDSDRFSRRHILPFPFRIPRTEESKNYAVKEYVEPSSSATATSNSNDNDSDSGNNGSSKVDKDKG